MQAYTVIYREPDAHPLDTPEVFICQAEDADHAEEQAENAYPRALILWIVETDSQDAALNAYYAAR